MDSFKQKWLVDFLVNNGFVVKNSNELQEKISGMTADDIIQAMSKAKDIQDNLRATSLGRELS
jgi:hypothetical protein